MKRLMVGWLLFFGLPSVLAWAPAQEREQQRIREERQDYYKKWLRQDVSYIITDEEESVFGQLETDDEKEQFIEQFWRRRDPDLRTAANEYKEEHYRRIAFANERFTSGKPGWMTDRGRIYIIHGPPDEIESHPTGGSYQRASHEGGGMTSTWPFEKWRYRHIEGLGLDVELEFVDKTGSNQYRLALSPHEKDALLNVPGAGLTMAEELGLASRADHPYFSPGNRDSYPAMHQRAKDNPFTQYETFAKVQSAKPIRYDDLKQIVDIDIRYENLPFKVRRDYFQLNDDQVLVPVTFEIENKNLSFKLENQVHVARVAVYGVVTSLSNRVVTEFDDDLVVSFDPSQLANGLEGSSIYQRIIPVDRKTRYKLSLVVKDQHSEQVGVQTTSILPPTFDSEKLSLSSVVLTDYLQVLSDIPDLEERFVLGDVKMRPNLGKAFEKTRPLATYFHIYNAGLDQATFSPALSLSYKVLKGQQAIFESADESGESIHSFAGMRTVVIKSLPLEQFDSGQYRLEVTVHDRITDQRASFQETFQISGHSNDTVRAN